MLVILIQKVAIILRKVRHQEIYERKYYLIIIMKKRYILLILFVIIVIIIIFLTRKDNKKEENFIVNNNEESSLIKKFDSVTETYKIIDENNQSVLLETKDEDELQRAWEFFLEYPNYRFEPPES